MHKRKVRAEGVFALSKELHGLRRTRFKGRWKVQIQVWLTAAVINIKRALGKLRKTSFMAKESQPTLPSILLLGLNRIADASKKITHYFSRYLLRLYNTSATAPADDAQPTNLVRAFSLNGIKHLNVSRQNHCGTLSIGASLRNVS